MSSVCGGLCHFLSVDENCTHGVCQRVYHVTFGNVFLRAESGLGQTACEKAGLAVQWLQFRRLLHTASAIANDCI